jgi:hypothetical protein
MLNTISKSNWLQFSIQTKFLQEKNTKNGKDSSISKGNTQKKYFAFITETA